MSNDPSSLGTFFTQPYDWSIYIPFQQKVAELKGKDKPEEGDSTIFDEVEGEFKSSQLVAFELAEAENKKLRYSKEVRLEML